MFKKKLYLIVFLISILLSYFVGFSSAVYGLFPYHQIHNLYKKILYINIFNKLDSCDVEEIINLPKKFSLIVGHAYGSPFKSKQKNFIAKNLDNFLSNNQEHIENIIFTGDVFSVPTSLKWNKLLDKYSSTNIYVAPGNHDVQRLDSKEIFNSTKLNSKFFPFEIIIEQKKLIIDDSVQSNWKISDKLLKLINSNNSDVLIARHNVPIIDLLPLSNSKAGFTDLPNLKDFQNNFELNNRITWIIGDGGAYSNLPRISCFEYLNHKFIVNGIGDVKGDTVLILHKNQIYKYIISKN
jgi:hypothetical protein